MNDRYTLEEWMGMLEEAGYGDEIKTLTTALNKAMAARGSATSVANIENLRKQLQQKRKQAKAQTASTNEAYTLEEWLGMLEEAGYDTSEVYSLWRPKEHGAKSTGVIKTTKKEEPKEKPVKKKMEEGNKEHEVKKESINENTVARLQSLAGIKPTE